MKTAKVYFAQPVDNIPYKTIKENVEEFELLIHDLPISIIAPYMDKVFHSVTTHINRSVAQKIVEEDYSALDTCDILLVDLSQDKRQAIGMIFEMAYAVSQRKVIIVYTGKTLLDRRVWVIAATNYICKTWSEVRSCFIDLLTEEC